MNNNTDIKPEELLAKLEIGTAIHVNTEDNAVKYRASLLGYDQSSLLTSLPGSKQLPIDKSAYFDLFSEQQVLIFRLITDGVIYAFKSIVLTTHTKYCKILLSSLPESVQARPLRKTVRYPCTLPGGFVIGETKYRGAVINISLSGCLFRMNALSNTAQLESIKANEHIAKLEVAFPLDQGGKSFDSTVRSIEEDSEGYLMLGMSFSDDETLVEKYIEFMQLEELVPFL
ncbi:MAG: PilZ domain-containing protein [Spongiibacteraceae bacterium]|nr:PilZ domain-containing protein [Spongiibacteraceae bacterium]